MWTAVGFVAAIFWPVATVAAFLFLSGTVSEQLHLRPLFDMSDVSPFFYLEAVAVMIAMSVVIGAASARNKIDRKYASISVWFLQFVVVAVTVVVVGGLSTLIVISYVHDTVVAIWNLPPFVTADTMPGSISALTLFFVNAITIYSSHSYVLRHPQLAST
jgi:hypothetical protein